MPKTIKRMRFLSLSLEERNKIIKEQFEEIMRTFDHNNCEHLYLAKHTKTREYGFGVTRWKIKCGEVFPTIGAVRGAPYPTRPGKKQRYHNRFAFIGKADLWCLVNWIKYTWCKKEECSEPEGIGRTEAEEDAEDRARDDTPDDEKSDAERIGAHGQAPAGPCKGAHERRDGPGIGDAADVQIEIRRLLGEL